MLTGAGNTGIAVYGNNASTATGSYGGYFSNSNNTTPLNAGAALGINGFAMLQGISNANQPAPTAPSSGIARMYYDTTNNALEVSLNGGLYTPLAVGSAGATDIDTQTDGLNNLARTMC